jgi:hypothetical protein
MPIFNHIRINHDLIHKSRTFDYDCANPDQRNKLNEDIKEKEGFLNWEKFIKRDKN